MSAEKHPDNTVPEGEVRKLFRAAAHTAERFPDIASAIRWADNGQAQQRAGRRGEN